LEKANKDLETPSKKKTRDELEEAVKVATEEYNKAVKAESEAKLVWENSEKYITKLREDIKEAAKDVEIAQNAIDNQSLGRKPSKQKSPLDETLEKAEAKLHRLQNLLSEYLERLNPTQIMVKGMIPGDSEATGSEASEKSNASVKSNTSEKSNTSSKSSASARAIASVKAALGPLVSRVQGLYRTKRGGKNFTQRKHPKEPVDLESVIDRLINKKAIAKLNKMPKTVVDEMRAMNPFPFEIAILCGFIKETSAGYEFVENRIHKLKEPIVQSISILNTRCKGENCNRRRTEREHPITGDEIESLGDALTAIKHVHTASIHALTREAVETKDTTVNGGGKRKVNPANVAKTMSHLKHIDIGWLEKTYPEDFKIANKLGIVKEGKFTEVTNNILSDSAELAEKTIKRKMPEIRLAQ